MKKANESYLQVLIKWSSLPPELATWEDYKVLKERFPEAAAWGQAATREGASVTHGVSHDVVTSETSTGSTPSMVGDE